MAYLSSEWIDAVSAEVARHADHLASAAAGIELGLTTIVDDDRGTVVYHLQAGESTVRFGSGRADPEHVVLRQRRDIATAVATGMLGAQEAFVRGDIVLRGDAELLKSAQPLLVELDRVLASARAATVYA